MYSRGFEGWYYSHRFGDYSLAFIPGRSESGAFVQMIDTNGSRKFDIPELTVENGVIHAGDCIFSSKGIVINLPNVRGKIKYGRLTPLRSDIMGPFRYLPMQCRHGVISMGHTLGGSITVDGITRRFDRGTGYIEKDSGISFPRSYLWMQCSGFTEKCSVMVSVAHIPFAGFSFAGCICAIIYRGKEYRLATYRGVRILAAEEGRIRLLQGGMLLEIDMKPSGKSHSLHAPVKGKMSGRIRECCDASVNVRLWNNGRPVFDLFSNHASYEAVLRDGKL